MCEKKFKSIALLIDGDNAMPSKIKGIIEKIEKEFGTITCRKVYGDFTEECLIKGWKNSVYENALKLECYFMCIKEKNATDMAMTIGAMDLLHESNHDAFAIVSSDSDFSNLVIRLRNASKYVIGFGRGNANPAYKGLFNSYVEIDSVEENKKQTAIKAPDNQKLSEFKELLLKVISSVPAVNHTYNISVLACGLRELDKDFMPSKYGKPTLSKLIKALHNCSTNKNTAIININ